MSSITNERATSKKRQFDEICSWEDEDLDLKNNLLRSIYAFGFEKPSPIQKKAIMPVVKTNYDIIAQAQSGTGKTGAFTVSVLQKINENENKSMALILAPTHELAGQTKHVFDALGKYMKVRTLLLVGGTSVEANKKALMNKDITIERNRSDFPVMLHNCALSLSQGGYNTIVEILKARAPAVIVPFSQGGETEQGLRARLLEERGLVKTLDENLLSPYTLAAKVDSAFSNSLPELSIDLNGAKKTADFLLEWVA